MVWYYYVFAILATIASAMKLYLLLTTGKYKIKKDLAGKVVVITGPTAGIGKETAMELAKAGAIIHMLCRNKHKGDKVARQIRKETDNANVFVHEMDLSSLTSIKHFADEFLHTEHPIHILINNAGILSGKKGKVTEDGFDETMQSNYFGHFYLTNLLLDKLKSSSPSRIINVSSMGHQWAENFDVTDLNLKHTKYRAFNPYCWSKLCNILFTVELAKKLDGTGVTVNSLHPGGIRTDIFNTQPFYYWPVILLIWPFMNTANEGAQTTLFLSVSDKVQNVSGYYFSDCKPSATSLLAMDGKLAADLWTETEKLLQTRFANGSFH